MLQLTSLFPNSAGQKNHLHFESDDVHIIDPAKETDKGVVVNFAVVYTDGVNTTVLSKQFLHQFFSSNIDNLAGYKVTEVDGESEMPPAGHHSAPQPQKSISIRVGVGVGVGVVLTLAAVLVVVVVVKRFVCQITELRFAITFFENDQLLVSVSDYIPQTLRFRDNPLILLFTVSRVS